MCITVPARRSIIRDGKKRFSGADDDEDGDGSDIDGGEDDDADGVDGRVD